MKRNSGFTLVEILIVVIILGILAAIVIPQFTEASNDARESALTSDLQTMRSQVELYKVQHLEQYPDAGSADAVKFVARLTSKTDNAGTVDDAGAYGPYLQKMPTNAFSTTSTIGQALGIGATPAAVSDSVGWYWDTKLGKMSACDQTKHLGL